MKNYVKNLSIIVRGCIVFSCISLICWNKLQASQTQVIKETVRAGDPDTPTPVRFSFPHYENFRFELQKPTLVAISFTELPEKNWIKQIANFNGECNVMTLNHFIRETLINESADDIFMVNVRGTISYCEGGGGGGSNTFSYTLVQDEGLWINPESQVTRVDDRVKLVAKDHITGAEVDVLWKLPDDCSDHSFFSETEDGDPLTLSNGWTEVALHTIWFSAGKPDSYTITAKKNTYENGTESTLSAEATVRAIKVEIDKIWNATYADYNGYYLPGGDGINKMNDEDFILVGVNSSVKNEISVGFKTDSLSHHDLIEQRTILVGLCNISHTDLVKITTPIVYGNIASAREVNVSDNGVIAIFENGIEFGEAQFLVLGFDANGDGQIQESEILNNNLFPIIPLSKENYDSSKETTVPFIMAWNSLYPIASIHMKYFKDQNYFDGNVAELHNYGISIKDSLIFSNDYRLEHPIGANFNGNQASVKQLIHGKNSILASKIKIHPSFINTLTNIITVQNYDSINNIFASNPNTTFNKFLFELKNGLDNKITIDYLGLQALVGEMDVWLAVGKAELSGHFFVTIVKEAGEYRITEVEVFFIQTDLYDWDYTIDRGFFGVGPNIDRELATIQANSPRLGPSHIFETVVKIEGYINGLVGKRF